MEANINSKKFKDKKKKNRKVSKYLEPEQKTLLQMQIDDTNAIQRQVKREIMRSSPLKND